MIKQIFIVCLLLLVAGCSVLPNQVPLTNKTKSSYSKINTISVVVQDEVIPKVKPSNVSGVVGGGLIAAMVDSSITGSRMNEALYTLEPFYWEVEDHDFRPIIEKKLKAKLASNKQFDFSSFELTNRYISNDAQKRIMYQLDSSEALMIIGVSYNFSMFFKTLDISSSVSIWKKGDPTPDSLIYLQKINVQSPYIGSGGEDSVELWSANNAKIYKENIELLTTELAATINNFTTHDYKSFQGEEVVVRFHNGQKDLPIKGKIINKSNSRVTLLAQDNVIYNLPFIEMKIKLL